MIIIKDTAEEMIKNLKSATGMDNVRFVKSYNGRFRENPVKGILVTVATGANSKESFLGDYVGNGVKGEQISSEIILNVYCPYHSGGEGITDTVNNILDGIYQQDVYGIISSVDVSEIKFSKEYEAVYRTIKVALDYSLVEGDSSE